MATWLLSPSGSAEPMVRFAPGDVVLAAQPWEQPHRRQVTLRQMTMAVARQAAGGKWFVPVPRAALLERVTWDEHGWQRLTLRVTVPTEGAGLAVGEFLDDAAATLAHRIEAHHALSGELEPVAGQDTVTVWWQGLAVRGSGRYDAMSGYVATFDVLVK